MKIQIISVLISMFVSVVDILDVIHPNVLIINRGRDSMSEEDEWCAILDCKHNDHGYCDYWGECPFDE